MKTLLLLRHAKSSWKNPSLADHERPLNKRGRKAAPQIGRWIAAHGLQPDLVLCSTATRARETLQLLLPEWTGPIPHTLQGELYHGEVGPLIGLLREVSEPAAKVLIVGHNPDLETCLEHFTGQSERLPTGGLAHIEFELSRWSELTEATRGRLASVTRPRELTDE